jgi:hypothetical protein
MPAHDDGHPLHAGIDAKLAEILFKNLKMISSNALQRCVFFDINTSITKIPVNKFFNFTNCTFEDPGMKIATPRLDPGRFKLGFVAEVKIDPPIEIKAEQ